MHISIAERFRPFSHVPGEFSQLPMSRLTFQIFPALIRVFDSETNELVVEFPVEIEGPISQFTVLQNLEKGDLRVWGESKKGYFRYRIHTNTRAAYGFTCAVEKAPTENPLISSSFCKEEVEYENLIIPRLSFGVTKAQDMTLINRRLLLMEILPLWFRMGQLIPTTVEHSTGTAGLLDVIERAIEANDPLSVSESFKILYQVGFQGLFSCSLSDQKHQGLNFPEIKLDKSCSPLVLLTKGTELIQRILLNVCGNHVDVLPCLLPELHAGRLCHVTLKGVGEFDLEWSKKKLRRMVFHSSADQTLLFQFQNHLKSFRLSQKGSKISRNESCGTLLEFQLNSTYYFDRFEQ